MRHPALASFATTTGTSSMPMNACTVSSAPTFSSVAPSASSSGTSTAATIAVSCSLAALPPRRRMRLFSGELLFVRLVGGLLRWDGDLLGRDLARDDGHVDLVGVALARHEDRRAPLERAAQDEVGQRVLDHALDRAAQRPGAHRGVVALLDQQLLRLVRQLDRDLVRRHLLADALHLDVDDVEDLF